MTQLFVFGLGYTAQAYAAHARASFDRIAGTVRSAARAGHTGRPADDVHLFDGSDAATRFDPAIGRDLAAADLLLVSAPPDQAGDPVLRFYADAISTAPRLKQIAYLSTVGVYGDHGGAWIDEDAALAPTSPRNARRVEVERQWLALGAATGRSVQVFRLAGIYGPGRNALVKLRDGRAQRLVKDGQVFNRIHVRDIAAAITAAWDGEVASAVWNVTDDEPGPPQDVIAYAAGLLGMSAPPEVPFAEADLTPMARSFWGENKRVSNRRLRRDLKVALAYPTYREGLDALATAGEGR
ncbi:SDR family oxidoreductase [Chelatococcus reniformis]|uniref:NAD(P)-dependent oxidoreductase n=1 Tax=Chelatococcus reniformis TaxID=1494448 RepID=A0A916XMA2_9HYPH|nr:SDR family oxidoreductase [Chelatococcus reniformis]GGC86121.1 NAD(P)-dependent oxidoreductase [Chelatococcus reniformis]